MKDFLQVRNIRRTIGEKVVINDVSFIQTRYEKIAIAGETGSGKTTLLKIIAGLEQADSGEVMFNNEKVKGANEKLVPGHKGIAFLSQHFELPKFLRVEQVLDYANKLTGKEAGKLFHLCEISHLLMRKTDELSGGERQRVAIARLLVSSPELLLLDEPYSNLDMVHKNTLKSVLESVVHKLKVSCILVSHDPLDTLSWSSRIMVMKGGHIIQSGTPMEVYYKPETEYVAGLFGKYTVLTVAMAKKMGIKTNVTIIVRPEHFKISLKPSARSIKGKLIDDFFYGSYRDAIVQLPDQVITARLTTKNVQPGDTVYISFNSTLKMV